MQRQQAEINYLGNQMRKGGEKGTLKQWVKA